VLLQPYRKSVPVVAPAGLEIKTADSSAVVEALVMHIDLTAPARSTGTAVELEAKSTAAATVSAQPAAPAMTLSPEPTESDAKAAVEKAKAVYCTAGSITPVTEGDLISVKNADGFTVYFTVSQVFSSQEIKLSK